MTRRQASPLAAKRARDVVRRLRLRDPQDIDIPLIAAHYGAVTLHRPLIREEGRLLRKGSRGIIVVNQAFEGTPRGRFVAAHELGHFMLHEGLDQFFICETADLSEYRSNGVEAEANQFAAELLMPEDLFAPLCDRNRPCLDDLQDLARRFSTSLMATAFRFARYCPEPFASIVSQKSRVLYVSRAASFPFYIEVGHYLAASSTYAGELHRGGTMPPDPQMVDANGWVEDDAAAESELLEHSMRLGDTGLVLTTLWVHA